MLGHLSKLDTHARERLILTIKKAPKAASKVPEPVEFSSRLKYRKAMIEHVASEAKAVVRDSMSKLEEIGLSIKTGPLASSIIVEGTAEQLTRALQEDDVENASLDEEITLIKPVEVDDTNTHDEGES